VASHGDPASGAGLLPLPSRPRSDICAFSDRCPEPRPPPHIFVMLTINIGKLKVYELFFSVPLDYKKPHDKQLRLFARSVEPAQKSTTAPSTSAGQNDSVPSSRRPWLVYLPGGPGFGARQPQDYPFTDFILEKGYQVCSGKIQVVESYHPRLVLHF
jgi:hypothetical protein